MPIFDYRCQQCDKTFEVIVLSRSETCACPECGSTALDRLASSTAPPPKTPGVLRKARTQAAREGHFSEYRASEKPKL